MDNTSRPLWRLLLLTSDSNKSIQLMCEECFTLLEYDAERLVGSADPAEIHPGISHHLELCSRCQTQIENWLEKLERDKKSSAV